MKNIWLLSVVFLLANCGQADRKGVIARQDTIPVTLIPLDQFGTQTTIEATGVFTTEDETVLGFKNGGVIARVYVKEGDAVSKGQLLATVLTSEVDAKAGQATLLLEKSKRDFDRAHKLYQDSVATLEQLQNARTALEIAQQDVKAIQFNQQYSRIHAPSNGYVLAKLAQEGQVVGPGTPVLQVNGAESSRWVLKVGVSDQQWAQIKPGNTATVETDAIDGEHIEAVVSSKSEAIDPKSGTFTVQLELIKKPLSKLAAGVFGKARIQVDAREGGRVWRIPYHALLDGNAKEGFVFVTQDGKKAKKQKVQILRIEKNEVVVSKGLESASSLIASGSAYLLDGSLIRVVDNQK